MLWFYLFVTTCAVGYFGWIADTVYPEMWAVGEPPTRGERFSQKMTKGAQHLMSCFWCLLVFAIVFG